MVDGEWRDDDGSVETVITNRTSWEKKMTDFETEVEVEVEVEMEIERMG